MKYFFALPFLLISLLAVSQSQPLTFRKVKGKVTDVSNRPFAGSNILLYGGSIGTSTDREGRFEFICPNDRAVLISVDNGKDPKFVVKVTPHDLFLDIQVNDLTTAYSTQYVGEWDKKKTYNLAHAMDVYLTPEYKKFSTPVMPSSGGFADIRIDEPVGDGDANVNKDPNLIYTAVEIQPQFKNGINDWTQYVAANLKIPESAKANNVQGRVIINFVVEKDGSLTNIKVIRGISEDCDKEAIRLVKSSPKWTPGKRNNGLAVRVSYSVPIAFTLPQ